MCDRKPGRDPWNLVLMCLMFDLYCALIWLWLTFDDTIARWLGLTP